MSRVLHILMTVAIFTSCTTSVNLKKEEPTSSIQTGGIGSKGTFVGSEINLETITFEAFKEKIRRSFKLLESSPTLIFMEQNRRNWTSPRTLTDLKYRFLVDLADKVCSEINPSDVGFSSPADVVTLYKNLTDSKIEDEVMASIVTQISSPLLTNDSQRYEMACALTLLHPKVYFKI